MAELSLEREGSLIEAGAIEEAKSLLEKKLEENPDSARAMYLLGICNFRLRRFGDAEPLFRSAIEINGDDHLALYYLGLCLERQNDADEAVRAYQRAIEVKPDFQEASRKLGQRGVSESPSDDSQGEPKLAVDATLARRVDRGTVNELSGPNQRIAGEFLLERHPRLRSFSFLFVLSLAALVPMMFVLYDAKSQFDFLLALLPWLLITGWLVLSSAVTKYWFYERRIDFQTGILFRKRTSLWLYQIEDIWLTRSPLNLLTNDSKLHLRAAQQSSPGRKPGHFRLTGLGNSKQMQRLFDELRDSALVERRAMKNIWV